MTTYPYVPAWFDGLGARKGPTLGLMFHMAEGGGTVGYLDNKGNPPSRGVSVHAVCDYFGKVTRMLSWTDASGSLNPADRSTDKAYFGHTALQAVLGDWWKDPNSAVLSMEIEGFAKNGPNPEQVAAAIAWGLDMRTRFPSLRGALGHADQTDTKGCPGTTAAMKSIFAGVGGHGLWTEETMTTFPLYTKPTTAIVKTGAWLYTNDGLVAGPGNVQLSPGRPLRAVGISGNNRIVDYNGKAMWVRLTDCTSVSEDPAVPAADCAAQVTAAIAADRAKARVVWP